MKKLLSLLLAAIMLAAGAVTAGAAVEGGSVSYTSREVTAYLYGTDDTLTMKCLFRSDLPTVPYISAVDYLNQLYTEPFTCVGNGDGTYTVSDSYGEMTVDVDKDTVHFEDFETFVESGTRPILDDETADYLMNEAEYESLSDMQAVDLDLAAYGLDVVASDGQVYFPLCTINDIFSSTYHAAVYLGGSLYFADVMEDEPYYDDAELFDSLMIDKTLAEFNYRELCFAMDHFYGCPPKSELALMIREKGFDQALEDYDVTTLRTRTMLRSGALLDYLYAMLYLNKYLNDGGHTYMSYGLEYGMSRLGSSTLMRAFYDTARDPADDRILTLYEYYDEMTQNLEASELLEQSRATAFAGMEKVKEWDEAVFYRQGSIGVFSFDSFTDAMVEPFKWSLDYAAANGIEDFIIDVSLNGGGATAVDYYILSVICGVTRMDYLNQLTGSRYYLEVTVDRNLDGEFDEADDEVGYEMRFALLTSRDSFSAANTLACLMKYYGVPVAGEQSGGGTCVVSMHYDSLGYAYAASDSLMMLTPDGDDLDGGAQPDIELPGRSASYRGFYDFQAIAERSRAYYLNQQNPTEPGTEPLTEPTEPAPLKPAESTAADWIAPLMPAVLYAAVFAIVLLTSRKKKGF